MPPILPWWDIYLSVALLPSVCGAIAIGAYFIRHAVKVARTPDDKLP